MPLFPRWPEDDIPVGHVTNGVHVPTWDSAGADSLWTENCGKGRWLGTTETVERDIRQVSDAKLWQFRTTASKSLVEYARARLSRDLDVAGTPPEEVEAAKHLFDPNALTLGFARRFATYKRPNLLLRDPQRLLRLLTNSERVGGATGIRSNPVATMMKTRVVGQFAIGGRAILPAAGSGRLKGRPQRGPQAKIGRPPRRCYANRPATQVSQDQLGFDFIPLPNRLLEFAA